MKRLGPSIIAALFLMAAAAAYKLAQHGGVLPADTDGRWAQAFIGLTLVVFANFIPKKLGKWRNFEAEKRAQTVSRIAGWSFMLAGLAYIALWLAAPLAIADISSMIVVGAAVAITFGFTVWACAARSGDATPASPTNN